MHPNVHSSTIDNSLVLEAPQVPMSKRVDPKTMVHLHNGILCNREKERAYTLCHSMDGTGAHNAKWNKPDGEGQIPYYLTFNWNITEEKRKQNITRDIEVKNNLTIARGEGRRDSGGREEGTVGRRVFRNYYKGHMDKTKGEGRSRGGRWVWLGCVERWGENADNCNWTTIK